MTEELEIRFNLPGETPDADTVMERLGDKINAARTENGITVVTFNVDGDDEEANQLWNMLYAIAEEFPGATLVD